jgi:hypothetical protein
MEVLAHIFVGKSNSPTNTFTTGFIKLPHKPVPAIKVINAPTRVVKGSYLDLQIGPYTPDQHGHSIDWFVDDKLSQDDAFNFHKQFSTLGNHTVRADLFQVQRNFGIQNKKFEKSAAEATFEVVTDEQYGDKSIEELENSPFRTKQVGLGDVVTSGEKSLKEVQHRIDQGGSQTEYWKDRLKAQKERLEKIKELAPGYATAKPLPADPTMLDPGVTYSGPVTATLVMSTGGGGAQPLSMHLTVSELGGVYSARLVDSTSKKVVKYDGTGKTALAAYGDCFDTWNSNNEYPTGGTVVHKFAPPLWNKGHSFSTTTTWKKAKDWVDGIIQIGGFIVGALLLSDPDPTASSSTPNVCNLERRPPKAWRRTSSRVARPQISRPMQIN